MGEGWSSDLEGARLHVALVVPPFERVPPERSGGIGLVVADLARALVRTGHRVTLFATGDSAVEGCETRALFSRPLWPPGALAERNHAMFAADALATLVVDVVHSHLPALRSFHGSFAAPVVDSAPSGPGEPLRLRADEAGLGARQGDLLVARYLALYRAAMRARLSEALSAES
jgi:hypothetical protein